ncbi:MAG: glycosyltransferase family 4 protein [Planctomycetota bacterium]
MKVLHVFGNWKWTGPAEPAVSLAEALSRSLAVTLAVGPCPFADLKNLVVAEAERRGLEPVIEPSLRKHLNALRLPHAAKRVARLLEKVGPELVHVHLDGDHAAVGLALRRGARAGAAGGPAIVRSFYEGAAAASGMRRRLLLRFATDGAIAVSQASFAELRRAWPRAGQRLRLIEGGVDLARFRPDLAARERGRARLDIAAGRFVVGVVARVQRHRRFETLLAAFARARQEQTNLVLAVIGRGTALEELAVRPAEKLGIKESVRFPGYLAGAAYVEVLAALDAAVFLVPGTDGSCRAVREEMAMGVPVVVSATPPLPELVGDRAQGLVVQVTEEALARAFVELARDPAEARRLGEAARRKAERCFGLEQTAAEVEDLYRCVLSAEGAAQA